MKIKIEFLSFTCLVFCSWLEVRWSMDCV